MIITFSFICYRTQLVRTNSVEINLLKHFVTINPLKKLNKTIVSKTLVKMAQCNSNVNTYNDSLPHKIGFVGGGKMALALAKGFMAAGLVSPDQVRLLYCCPDCNYRSKMDTFVSSYSLFLITHRFLQVPLRIII